MAQMTTKQLIEAKRKELAELEAQLTAGVTPGTIAVVTELGLHEDIRVGTLVRITEIDRAYDEPYLAELLDGSDWDRFSVSQLDPVTREEARAHLIAEVERQLDAAFN